ncbi:hypothetical protein A3A93_02810 [Candidatus Roizmanbacteria bacterium RIFCSPLOWO2_01_FULL_38_12]|uniref:Glycosyltransferase 2-like domain-containing protein n=1 Tax=Candidatus Roizmanbacteria bacterium RIFCSPLOWO2_01_FULL_38_12 TaxID=1802061 RepID=A0A1F7IUK3_9BACT|nr:MAG: hypothetical protein A2861_01885 [Candidatus Roizmanbacteria bacterium RIFCSPHIGHO2_01_FULL_38_15]OGK34330.1 MAG: hypothetical protein A3F59_04795 [Candidatus Roizmanbacteria bacterium RIFCSPHIGHO2_12_FULL_38_13]OGK47028.1 MAG: hypothetical protein A3A93_02810 [Candidatus Roizmanbacteria bacterium RIFCSPLOWO2_01_FULL_38_12]
MKSKKQISIIIPCFNEELNIPKTNKEIKKIFLTINKYNHEMIFVDNGSTDDTKKEITKLAKRDSNIRAIFLSRNFGPEASLQAGLDYACGDVIISIPCDLQDPPALIPEFIKKWEEGNTIVTGIYTKSEDDFFTAFLRKTFYAIFKKISNIEIPVNASGVGLLDRKALNALNSLPEKYRFFRGLRSWVGFKTAYIVYEKKKRNKGNSSYNLFNYIKHAERGIFGFSYLFLDLIVYVGFIFVILSFLFVLWYVLFSLLFGNPIKGSITILVSIVFFGGIQLLAISIIGKYIQVVVEETKSRPVYIVDKVISKIKQ